MTPGTIWIIAGLLGCAAEMAAPGAFLLPIGLAACGTGAATEWLDLHGAGQVLLFVALTAGFVTAAWFMQGRKPRSDAVNGPTAGLIGQTCRALAFEDGEGRVVLGDGTWQARTIGRTSLTTGTLLTIVGLDGTTLLVEPRPDPSALPLKGTNLAG